MPSSTWMDSNQKYLAANIENTMILLEKYKERDNRDNADTGIISENNSKNSRGSSSSKNTRNLLKENRDEEKQHSQKSIARWTEESPPALENICMLFGLSSFERSIILLCAGVELNAEFAKLCAKAQGDSNLTYPTFGLALAAFPDAHWSAITPASPLRQFRLIEVFTNMLPPLPLTYCPIRIEERLLHYLSGLSYMDSALRRLVSPIRENVSLIESHKDLVSQIMFSCRNAKGKKMLLPIIQLLGSDKDSKLLIAQEVCRRLGLSLWQLHTELIQTKPEDVDSFVQLWTREAALLGAGLYISAENIEESLQRNIVMRLAEDLPGPVFLGTRERWPPQNRLGISLEVKKPTKAEQLHLWRSYLDDKGFPIGLNSQLLLKIVNQFDLNSQTILSIVNEADLLSKKNAPGGDDNNNNNTFDTLWSSCLEASSPKIHLVQRIKSNLAMDDLVLPDKEKRLLHEIVIYAANRAKVYEEWGFEDATAGRGLGIIVLFTGASGTGKTMAAEVLANELHLDLFRIDLSIVVNKYIGETEKNLRKVFDAAEEGGSVLFFDEADALFGKRTEVKDSHDRYANIEINYLLQRMERYRGLAILATNMKNAIDSAFMRRIRFMVEFPFPDERKREEIWMRIFPSATPLAGSVNFHRLARLNISGGSIRNIALNAAFLAADEGVSVNIRHLNRAAQSEYVKLERPLTQAELEVFGSNKKNENTHQD